MRAELNDKLLVRVESLPTLPAIATQLLELTLSDDVSTSTIGGILSKDPSLTAKVLKVVNSAAFGLRFPVSNLSYAITVLGLQRMRTLILSLSFFETLAKVHDKGQLDKMAFWRHSVASAAAAKALANATGRLVNPEEAYVAGLIHDIGMLLLDTLAPKEYRQVLQEFQITGANSLLNLEEGIAGISHVEIGSRLALRWNLPKALCGAIRHHHAPEEAVDPMDLPTQNLVAVTAAADYLAWSAGYPSAETPIPPKPGVAVLDLLQGIDLVAIQNHIHEEVRKGAEIFQYSDPKGERWQQALLRANSELGRINAQLELANRGLASLNNALLNTQHRLGEHNPVESLLAEIVGTLGYDRAFLLAPESKGHYRVWKMMSNDGTGSDLEGAEIVTQDEITPSPNAGVRLKASANPEDIHPLLQVLRATEMVVAPIAEGRNVRFLLAVDKGNSGQLLASNAEETLACLTVQAGLLLENYRLYQTVQDMAVTDPLTGVCNRRRLMEVLSEEADRAARTRQPFSVAILDIDFFKMLNDRLGHLAGDQILKKVGELLRNSIRQGDLVGRYGGEEFLILLPGADIPKATIAAERMRKNIEQFGKSSASYLRGNTLTISVGVAELTLEKENFEGLIARADKALYRAKELGRNQVQIAAPLEEEPKNEPTS